MAIQFTVEDGTGKTDATSYCTVAEFRQYWLNRGVVYAEDPAPEDDEEQATTEEDKVKAYLNLATEYIDNLNFLGEPSSDTQALQWPRIGITDVDSNEIPKALKNACCFLGGNSTRLNVVADGVKAESFGPVSKTYTGLAIQFPVAEKLLAKYMIAGNTLVRVN